MKPRSIGADGFNSFWHFVFGILAFKFPIIIVLFVLYQLYTDWNNINLYVDLSEFFLALGLVYIIKYLGIINVK